MKHSTIALMALLGWVSSAWADAPARSAWEVYQNLPDDERAQVALELVFNRIPEEALSQVVFKYDEEDGSIELDTALTAMTTSLTREHAIYLGVRFGMPFLMGLDLTYFNFNEAGRVRFHVSADLATSILVNAASASVGVHPWGNAIYIGGRVHQIWGIDLFDGDPNRDFLDAGHGIGLEIGWTPQLGRNGRVMLLVRAGGFVFVPRSGEAALFPDIAIGLRIRLGR